MDPLYHWLHSTPFQFNYEIPSGNEEIRQIIERECVKAMFPSIDDAHTFLTRQGLEKFFNIVSPVENSSKTSKSLICGHIFKKGEPVYRCRTCGLDDTCVMCLNCFRSSDHEGHEIHFHLAHQPGGCCDCGDIEAWKTDIRCRLHPRELQTFADAAISSYPEAVDTMFDFIIDSIEDAPLTTNSLPSPSEITASAIPETTIEARLKESNQFPYALVLWNDEQHSFAEVISQVGEATGCRKEAAKRIAENVDAHGREVIKIGTNVEELYMSATVIRQIQLTATIAPARETFREEVAGILVGLLSNLADFALEDGVATSNGERMESPRNLLRKIIAESLFSAPRRLKSTMYPSSKTPTRSEEDIELDAIMAEEWTSLVLQDEQSKFMDLSYKSRLDHLLCSDVKLWKRTRGDLKQLLISNIVRQADDEPKRILGVRFAYSYLKMVQLYLFKDREYDLNILVFGVQVFTVPKIASLLLLKTPLLTTLCGILKAFFLADVSPLQYSHEKFFASYRLARKDMFSQYRKSNCELEAARNRKYDILFQHFKYLLMTPEVQNHLFRRYKLTKDLGVVFDLFRVWQGMHQQQRYSGQHIEYETDTWVPAFTLSAELERIISALAACFAPTQDTQDPLALSLNALMHTITVNLYIIDAWCAVEQTHEAAFKGIGDQISPPGTGYAEVILYGSRYNVPQFKVSQQQLSFHHPLHWLFSYLSEYIPKYIAAGLGQQTRGFTVWKALFDKFSRVSDNASRSSSQEGTGELTGKKEAVPQNTESLSSATAALSRTPPAQQHNRPIPPVQSIDLKILRLMEEPLRTQVLLSQIAAGIWVRNGMSVRSQAQHYREVTLRDCHDHDIFMLQICANVIDSNQFLASVLDRFELVDWFQGLTSTRNGDIDPSHKTSMAEDLLRLLITLLTERTFVGAVPVEEQIRREIIHHLAASGNGLAYSELTRRIPEKLQEDGTRFDKLLLEIAKFRYPEGIADKGQYELKPEYYDQVDPWFWHYTKNQREEVEDILSKRQREKGTGMNQKYSFYKLDTPDVTAVAPARIERVSVDTGFDVLNRIAFSEVFVSTVFWSIFNFVKQVDPVKNDDILNESLYLCKVSLKLEDALSCSEFSMRAAQIALKVGEGEGYTLLQLCFKLLEDLKESTEHDQQLAQVKFVVKGIVAHANAENLYQEWLDEKCRDIIITESQEETEASRKKQAAQARKAALLAQMQQAQQSFMDVMAEEFDEDEIEMMETVADENVNWEFPTGTCIVCQEDLNSRGLPYGLVGHTQPTCIQRSIDFADVTIVNDVLRLVPGSLDVKIEAENTNINSSPGIRKILNPNASHYGLYASTCGHLLHFKCFETYFASVKSRQTQQTTRNPPEDTRLDEYLCPLCKSLSNVILPVHFDPLKERVLTPFPQPDDPNGRISSALEAIYSQNLSISVSNLMVSLENRNTGELQCLASQDPARFFSLAQLDQRTNTVLMMPQLTSVYREYQLKLVNLVSVHNNTIVSLEQEQSQPSDSDPLCDNVFLCSKLLADTISSIEIMSRGSGGLAPPADGILGTLNHQHLMLLRVLSKVVDHHTLLHLKHLTTFQLARVQSSVSQLFALIGNSMEAPKVSILTKDVFLLFVHWCNLGLPILQGHATQPAQASDQVFVFLNLFWYVSVLKGFVAVIESVWAREEVWAVPCSPESHKGPAHALLDKLVMSLPFPGGVKSQVLAKLATISESILLSLSKSSALPFLRRCVLLLYGKYGMTISCGPGDDETDRLCAVLRLPSVLDAILILTRDDCPLNQVIGGWITHFAHANQPYLIQHESQAIPLRRLVEIPSPLVFQFIGLPQKLDMLLEESMDKVCKNCGTVPLYSAWCLVCGDYLCSQSFCCSDNENGFGELNIHKRRCGAGVGVFYLNRKGAIVLLHGENKGVFMQPPYMDVHGEVDIGLRRGRPLFLNSKRYNEVRKLWVSHGIPSYVARKMEQVYDVGGWMTM